MRDVDITDRATQAAKGRPRYRYERLGDELLALVRQGTYRPGERLPSVRTLARQRRLSISTVVQALHRLEALGVIETRPQSGHFVRPPPAAAGGRAPPPRLEPVAVRVSQRILQLYDRPGVARLGPAAPAAELIPMQALKRSLAAATRHGDALLQGTGYGPLIEEPLARQLVRLALEWGGTLDAGELIATNGCVEALALCLRAVTRPGDTVAVGSPGYYLMLELLESLGLHALEIPSDPASGVSVDAIERATRERRVAACLLMSSVDNPLGATMPDAAKQRLAALLAERGVPLIEDDINGDLAFDGPRPRPVKAFDATGNVMWCSSFSKTLSPQLRLGFVAAGRRHAELAGLKRLTTGTASPLVQRAVAHYLASGHYVRHLRGLRRALAGQVERMRATVLDAFPHGTRTSRPSGGLALWVELPGAIDASALFERAVREDIAFVPGELFSARGAFRNCLRLNCGNPWSAAIEAAVRRLGTLAHAGLREAAARQAAGRAPGPLSAGLPIQPVHHRSPAA